MDQHPYTKKRSMRIFITLVTALTGGAAFKLLHLPIPWLLGPMIAALVGSSALNGRCFWPGQVRNAGLIIVGYTIGLSMTTTALRGMSYQLPTMLLMTVLLLLMCTGIAYVVSKLSGIDYQTALMGSIPGGLSQIIILAEETQGINITVVTVMQVIRLMMIIVCVPLLILSPMLGQRQEGTMGTQVMSVVHGDGSGLFPNLLIYMAVCIVCALAGNKVKFPTAFLLGPAMGTAILQMSGLHGPTLPTILINAAQLMIGTYVGLLMKPGKLARKLRTISLAVMNGFVLIVGALGFSMLLTKLQSVSMSTGLLSVAPGGMDQMGLIAHEVNADLSTVAGYQLFRTFFIFFAVPPLLRMFIKYDARRRKTFTENREKREG